MDNKIPCSTLVFFDIRTTGIPKFHYRTRITELSFRSVERSQFLSTGNQQLDESQLPRVTNGINLCINPGRTVDLLATDTFLLDNYNLEHQSPFNEDVFNVIFSFLNRLKKPVCLIAQNGYKFDYPIFKAELEKLGKVFSISYFKLCYTRLLFSNCVKQRLPDDLMCADSLPILKTFLPRDSRKQSSKKIAITPAALLNANNHHLKDGSTVNPFQLVNETTPVKKNNSANRDQVKRRLPINPRPRFDLKYIYLRMFGKPLSRSLHQAEADVLTLFEMAISKSADFISEVDKRAIPFNRITKSW